MSFYHAAAPNQSDEPDTSRRGCFKFKRNESRYAYPVAYFGVFSMVVLLDQIAYNNFLLSPA